MSLDFEFSLWIDLNPQSPPIHWSHPPGRVPMMLLSSPYFTPTSRRTFFYSPEWVESVLWRAWRRMKTSILPPFNFSLGSHFPSDVLRRGRLEVYHQTPTPRIHQKTEVVHLYYSLLPPSARYLSDFLHLFKLKHRNLRIFHLWELTTSSQSPLT